MSTTNKKRTITLTGRAPVKISDAAWPTIASARGFWGEHECQASEVYWLRVRQHADGRVLVYGYRDRGPGGMPIEYDGWRGGEILAAGEDIAAAIRRIGDDGGLPDSLVRDAVSGLPAEEI